MPTPFIREDVGEHLRELKLWLQEQENVPLEEMGAFFTARISDYEAHMALWEEGYRLLPELIPGDAKDVLDLGCGTGLELDAILPLRPELKVTGIDLCEAMLRRLREKHPGVKTVCGDYFETELGAAQYDAVISFESLHHFTPEKKLGLFEKIYDALRPGGVFMNVDYLACCMEEERLLWEFAARKRRTQNIPPEQFVHFDTPLTAEVELELLRKAGFSVVEWLFAVEGASFVRCIKEERK